MWPPSDARLKRRLDGGATRSTVAAAKTARTHALLYPSVRLPLHSSPRFLYALVSRLSLLMKPASTPVGLKCVGGGAHDPISSRGSVISMSCKGHTHTQRHITCSLISTGSLGFIGATAGVCRRNLTINQHVVHSGVTCQDNTLKNQKELKRGRGREGSGSNTVMADK